MSMDASKQVRDSIGVARHPDVIAREGGRPSIPDPRVSSAALRRTGSPAFAGDDGCGKLGPDRFRILKDDKC
jgi:hypothetical protein